MLNRLTTKSVLGLSVALSLGVAVGCDDPFANCYEGVDCPVDDSGLSGGASPGGESSGGSANSGGSKTGGADNSGGGGATSGGTTNSGGATSGGMGGEPAGGAAPVPCDGKCDGETPLCDDRKTEDRADDKCVGCIGHSDCKDPTKPMCDLPQLCVPCEDDFSCTDTIGLPEPVVCLNGQSVEEPFEERPDTGACAECGMSADCGGAICDLETLTCIEGTFYKGKGLCDECTDDRECKDGQLCVEMKYDDPSEAVVGTFCLWRKDATGVAAPKGTCGINSRPYSTSIPARSVNGVETEVCTLATSTCPALKQHRTAVAGCEEEGDDDACGAEGFNDGRCRLDGNSDPKCTYRCGGPEDCDGFSCFDTGSEKYCAL
jgi:hypothetical protein